MGIWPFKRRKEPAKEPAREKPPVPEIATANYLRDHCTWRTLMHMSYRDGGGAFDEECVEFPRLTRYTASAPGGTGRHNLYVDLCELPRDAWDEAAELLNAPSPEETP